MNAERPAPPQFPVSTVERGSARGERVAATICGSPAGSISADSVSDTDLLPRMGGWRRRTRVSLPHSSTSPGTGWFREIWRCRVWWRWLICHECGQAHSYLGLHVYRAHGLRAADYRKRHVQICRPCAWNPRAGLHLVEPGFGTVPTEGESLVSSGPGRRS
jgi:hypothetical protein